MSKAQPSQEELKQMIAQGDAQKMLKTLTGQITAKVGNVILSVLNNFAPHPDIGLGALCNIFATTGVSNGVPLEVMHEHLARAYEIAATNKAALDAGEQPKAPEPSRILRPV